MDAYTARARLGPAFLAALPAIALCGAAAFSPQEAIRIGGTALGVLGVVVCGLVRDRGRAIQPGLWARWGGSPTVRRLRWRDSSNAAATQRLHDRINSVLDEKLPDANEEATDPRDADARYDEAVAALRTRTRDKERFRLVFEENVDYGFRRNALGVRPVAIPIAALVLVLSLILLLFGDGSVTSRLVRWGTTGGFSLLVLMYWWRVVSEDWCKRAAENYADRLLEAVETLRAASAGS